MKKPVPVSNCSVHLLDTVRMEIYEEKQSFNNSVKGSFEGHGN